MSSAPRKSSTPTQPTATQHSGNANVNYAAVFNAPAAATSRPYASDLGHVWGSGSAPNTGVRASASAPTAATANSQGGAAKPVTAVQLFTYGKNASGAPAAAADLAHFWGPGAAKRNT